MGESNKNPFMQQLLNFREALLRKNNRSPAFQKYSIQSTSFCLCIRLVFVITRCRVNVIFETLLSENIAYIVIESLNHFVFGFVFAFLFVLSLSSPDDKLSEHIYGFYTLYTYSIQ